MPFDNQGRGVGGSFGPFTGLAERSAKVDALNVRAIDWLFAITNLGAVNIVSLNVLVQYATKVLPVEATDDDWATVPYDDVVPATGIATARPYLTIIACGAIVPVTLGLTSNVRGRWMRLAYTATGGDPIGSVYNLTALRRML